MPKGREKNKNPKLAYLHRGAIQEKKKKKKKKKRRPTVLYACCSPYPPRLFDLRKGNGTEPFQIREGKEENYTLASSFVNFLPLLYLCQLHLLVSYPHNHYRYHCTRTRPGIQIKKTPATTAKPRSPSPSFASFALFFLRQQEGPSITPRPDKHSVVHHV
ncbi:hypothetical protein ASPVEDRAFT_338484 [Aspergillus versicolor CBS 583.65]|uniref:Uncharacterized protein n=1 Tax=Aspergillus versicolor CBS 583.65 TaxID=1036611 RepID=A0A1L9PZ82_ASPVE|nr:uncharacterized protein ASPVEDRAFT_338484 [Aspergillus versicolor CBS 583.65]OJJ06828.1 hypothetical protein ASPVEDRAFT_338484 [Aspergillus versicolor CBS 583.65]